MPYYPDSDTETEEIIRSVIRGDHTESIYIMDMSPRNPVPFEVLTFSTSMGEATYKLGGANAPTNF